MWCFDHRFDLVLRKFLKRSGIEKPDAIRIGGGAKSLASPEAERDRQFVLDQIRKSIRLHGTTRVILMLHSDCGAYGGLDGAFGGDPRVEVERQREELARAVAILRAEIPDIEIRSYWIDFEGVWDPEPD